MSWRGDGRRSCSSGAAPAASKQKRHGRDTVPLVRSQLTSGAGGLDNLPAYRMTHRSTPTQLTYPYRVAWAAASDDKGRASWLMTSWTRYAARPKSTLPASCTRCVRSIGGGPTYTLGAARHATNSASVLAPLLKLHPAQDSARLSGQFVPPRLMGVLWSMCMGLTSSAPQ